MKRAVVLGVLVLVACSRRAPLASCEDDLGGVYLADAERWMLLDHGETLEAYPLFPDVAAAGPDGAPPADRDRVVVAPRAIDLTRGAAASAGPSAGELPRAGPPATSALAGTLRRRYMQRAEACEAHVPVHVTRCAGETLELVLADPSPPLAYAPCTWPRPGPSRVVRWHRE